jgi:hypothetical protein
MAKWKAARLNRPHMRDNYRSGIDGVQSEVSRLGPAAGAKCRWAGIRLICCLVVVTRYKRRAEATSELAGSQK